MAQITGNLYFVRYKVVKPHATTVHPPDLVDIQDSYVIVNAASQTAIQAVVNSASGVSGGLVAQVEAIEQIHPNTPIWQ